MIDRAKMHQLIGYERSDIDFYHREISFMNEQRKKCKKPEIVKLFDEIISECEKSISTAKNNIKKLMKGE